MEQPTINTLGALKASGYKRRTIKEELRSNLRDRIAAGVNTFEGIWGFEHTVVPELERAILSGHNINLLGLRGQAKTRLARMMVALLDEWIPYVAGSEIHDDPFQPLSRFANDLLSEKGDETPILWLHRTERFYEKLATPDVTVADLIGDIDPIKAANLKLSYADDRVLHFGMIPRANRCIFVINELPDLQARIQVALFNILQEGDVQMRGFKVRLNLDIQFVFTANPEDYTNRGSIVTPLKDRIGSQILTHYPESIEIAKRITAQEAKIRTDLADRIEVPSLAADLIEQIGFEARKSEYVDVKSGVSARMSISAFENLISSVERRMLRSGVESSTVRLSDFMGIIPAITGKVELLYEGEQEGAAVVAEHLINAAVRSLFEVYFPKIAKLEKPGEKGPYQELAEWFAANEIELMDEDSDGDYQARLDEAWPLGQIVQKYQPKIKAVDRYFAYEMILWTLAHHKKIGKTRFTEGFQFNHLMGDFRKQL
jgi:magnesium chelatase subunit I